MKKQLYSQIKEKIDNLEKLINGGKGSGNFGHSGRPGQVGGSGDSGLVSSSDSSLGVSPEDFEKARETYLERAGKMKIEKQDDGYHAKDKFYHRKFDSEREAKAFEAGYRYGTDAMAFTQVDYVRKTQDGENKWEVTYKGTDYGLGERASFNNPLEAQRWAEGYNAKVRGIESEVLPSAWKKKK